MVTSHYKLLKSENSNISSRESCSICYVIYCITAVSPLYKCMLAVHLCSYHD